MSFLSATYFGNTFGQYLLFLLVLTFSLLFAKLTYHFFHNIISRWVRKTRFEFDDVLVDILQEPLSLAIIILGFSYAIKLLTLSQEVFQFYFILVRILVIINATWFVVRLVDSVVVHYLTPFVRSARDIDDAVLRLMRRLMKFAGAALTVIILADNWGYDVTALIAGLGIGGLAIALASQDILGNLFGGISVITDKPFKHGDYIRFDKYEGYVDDIGLRSTKIITADGHVLSVPNLVLTKAVIENMGKKVTKKKGRKK